MPYKVIYELGQGGQGKVYLVEDKQTRKIRAMKVGPSNDIDHEYAIIQTMMGEVDSNDKYSDIKLVRVYATGEYNDPCNERLEDLNTLLWTIYRKTI